MTEDYQKLNNEAYDFMISGESGLDRNDKLKVVELSEGIAFDREIKLFRNENSELLVDMTQFKDAPSAIIVSKQYRSIHLYD